MIKQMRKILTDLRDGCGAFYNAINYRFDEYKWWEWDRDFWEEINVGWYQMYIWPYDDWFNGNLSKERMLRLGDPLPVVEVPIEVYDELVKAINTPPSENRIAKTMAVLKRKTPWDDSSESGTDPSL